MGDQKRADPETNLEVDIMILDYLLYMAAKAVMAQRRADLQGTEVDEGERPDLALSMVQSFLTIFKSNHPTSPVPQSLDFRLRLLKFTTLFCQRLVHCASTPSLSSLEGLRGQHAERADRFYKAPTGVRPSALPVFQALNHDLANTIPLSKETRARHRTRILTDLLQNPAHRNQAYSHYGKPQSLSLLDLLPRFIEISARVKTAVEEFTITEQWMQLAGEAMLQAVLEQYLVYGAQGWEVVDEAFAWGYRGQNGGGGGDGDEEASEDEEDDEEDDDDDEDGLVGKLFENEERPGEEIADWTRIRRYWLRKLLSRPSPSASSSNTPTLQMHLETAALHHPLADFEKQLLSFLSAMSRALPLPALTQLEVGDIEGMNAKQTNILRERVGLIRKGRESAAFGGSAVLHRRQVEGKSRDGSRQEEMCGGFRKKTMA